MKIIFTTLVCSALLITSCSDQTDFKGKVVEELVPLTVPEVVASKSSLERDATTTLWTLNRQPYSGFAVSYYADSSIREKIGFYKGRKQDESIQWYEDGHLKNISNFYQGKLHGEKKVWSADSTHTLVAHYNFYNGKGHKKQTKWYSTGELYMKLNYNHGIEDGLQQAYRKNGALYANYEAKEGRIFGLKKAALCFGLEDQKLNYEE